MTGISASFLLLLWPIARPTILAYFTDSLYTLRPNISSAGKRQLQVDVTPQGALFFPGAEFLRDFFQDEVINPDNSAVEVYIKGHAPEGSPVKVQITEITEEVVFNGTHLTDSDYSRCAGKSFFLLSSLRV